MYGLLSFLIFGVLVLMVLGSVSWLVSGYFFSYLGVDLIWLVCFDSVSLVCVLMLFCCGCLALLFCGHYFGGDSSGSLLFPLIVWFLGVMAFLIHSCSLIVSLIFWEYLGFVSFLLILFYSNMGSLRASLITLFASRFGDVSLFLMIGWLFHWFGVSPIIFGLFFLLVVLTKSACYPFISWLLEAMRAPTPVSSLVHSSTLVAAGVWFLLRYDFLCVGWVKSVLFMLCLVTVVITAVCATFFSDLKKIVALSTCNNVSWCVVFFICGDCDIALLQLLTHGVCKCYLFMSVGDLMSHSGSSQSSVGVFLGRYVGLFGVLVQSVLIVSLCGLPFLGVYFSKHGLFSNFFYSCSLGSMVLMLLGFFLSCVYSIRFLLLLISRCGGIVDGYSSVFYLISGVCVFGTFVNYLGGVLVSEVSSLSGSMSVFLLLLQALGCLSGWLSYSLGYRLLNVWESLLWGSDSVVRFGYMSFLAVWDVVLLSVYRWELYCVGLFPGFSSLFGRFSLLSVNFLVCGLVFVLFFYVIVLV